ncbi:MAG: tyrosine recombinase XerC [Limnohabitans sp.]|nr:tyrosine recombinase XerC [Limnohabitans sp.]
MSDDAALVQRYLAHAQFEKRLAARTVALYTADLQRLQALADKDKVALTAVQPHHMRRWMAHMHSSGRSPRGIALITSGWRGFYAWLGREGLVSSNPLAGMRAPKSAKPLPKALNVDDAVQLASHHNDEQDPWLQARDIAMVELLYSSGLRVAELTGLDVQASATARGWIDMDSTEAHVLGKGSKRRSVPVGTQAIAALQHWISLRAQQLPEYAQTQTALFVGIRGTRLSSQAVWQRLRARGVQAGISTPVHPHMLRHSFASHVLQSSGDLRAVQELLGHANIGTTQIYTRLDYQHLAKAYDAAHPRARRKKP